MSLVDLLKRLWLDRPIKSELKQVRTILICEVGLISESKLSFQIGTKSSRQAASIALLPNFAADELMSSELKN